jgi:hypothetical protein
MRSIIYLKISIRSISKMFKNLICKKLKNFEAEWHVYAIIPGLRSNWKNSLFMIKNRDKIKIIQKMMQNYKHSHTH